METKRVIPFICACFLVACGGGESQQSTPPVTSLPPPTTNSAPTVSSVSNVSIVKFQTGKIYTLTATDSDGVIAELSLSDSPDSAHFSFDEDSGELYLSSPLTDPVDQGTNNVYDLIFTVTDDDGASSSANVFITVMDAGAPPSSNFDLLDWKLDLPVNENGELTGQSISISETNLDDGYESQYFYTGFDGGIVMRAPSQGATTSSGTIYTRTEFREMLRRGNTRIRTRGSDDVPNLNNWAFSSAPEEAQEDAGGIDGTLCVTMAVNEVTKTGENFEIGRVIIGQIHAADDEPIRLYYRKLPGNENGSIYAAHEISGGEDIYYNLVGSRDNNEPNPESGFNLNEKFSYIIDVKGNALDVEILQNDALVAETTIDMSESGYDVLNDFMYFKAGAYHVNNDADSNEGAQVTFYQLDNNHTGYEFNTSNCAATTP